MKKILFLCLLVLSASSFAYMGDKAISLSVNPQHVEKFEKTNICQNCDLNSMVTKIDKVYDGANIIGSNISGVITYGKSWKNSDLSYTTSDSNRPLGIANIVNDFTNSKFKNVKFKGAILRGKFNFTDFTNAILINSEINGEFIGANFTNANLASSVIINGADMSSTNFTYANFIDSNLSSVNFISSKFIGANLTNIRIINSNASSADFTGANLTGSKFIKASFCNAIVSLEQINQIVDKSCSVAPDCITVYPSKDGKPCL